MRVYNIIHSSLWFLIVSNCSLVASNQIRSDGLHERSFKNLRQSNPENKLAKFTAAGRGQLIAPVGAVSLAVTQPAFGNAGVRPRTAEQPWSTRHRAWEEAEARGQMH